jgi:hypothetical protein
MSLSSRLLEHGAFFQRESQRIDELRAAALSRTRLGAATTLAPVRVGFAHADPFAGATLRSRPASSSAAAATSRGVAADPHFQGLRAAARERPRSANARGNSSALASETSVLRAQPCAAPSALASPPTKSGAAGARKRSARPLAGVSRPPRARSPFYVESDLHRAGANAAPQRVPSPLRSAATDAARQTTSTARVDTTVVPVPDVSAISNSRGRRRRDAANVDAAHKVSPRAAADAAFVRSGSAIAVPEHSVPASHAHEHNLREGAESRIARCLRNGFSLPAAAADGSPTGSSFVFDDEAIVQSGLSPQRPLPSGACVECLLEEHPPATFAIANGRKCARSQLSFVVRPAAAAASDASASSASIAAASTSALTMVVATAQPPTLDTASTPPRTPAATAAPAESPIALAAPRFDAPALRRAFPEEGALFAQHRALVTAAEGVARLPATDLVATYVSVFCAADSDCFTVPSHAAPPADATATAAGNAALELSGSSAAPPAEQRGASALSGGDCLSPLHASDGSAAASPPSSVRAGDAPSGGADAGRFYASPVSAPSASPVRGAAMTAPAAPPQALLGSAVLGRGDRDAAPALASPALTRILDLRGVSAQRYPVLVASWSALWAVAVALDSPCVAAHRRFDNDIVLPRRPSLHELQSEFFGGAAVSRVSRFEGGPQRATAPKECTLAAKVVAATSRFTGLPRAHAARLDAALTHAARWIAEAAVINDNARAWQEAAVVAAANAPTPRSASSASASASVSPASTQRVRRERAIANIRAALSDQAVPALEAALEALHVVTAAAPEHERSAVRVAEAALLWAGSLRAAAVRSL